MQVLSYLKKDIELDDSLCFRKFSEIEYLSVIVADNHSSNGLRELAEADYEEAILKAILMETVKSKKVIGLCTDAIPNVCGMAMVQIM